MSEQSSVVHQFSRPRGNGETLRTQYSPVTARGRLMVSETDNPDRLGIFTYNLRTKLGHTAAYRQFYFAEDSMALGQILVDELVSQGHELGHPMGYPEVRLMADDTLRGKQLGYGQLQPGEFYLHSYMDYLQEDSYKIFQFSALEDRQDGMGAPFIGVTYTPDVLGHNLGSMEFTGRHYEPFMRSESSYGPYEHVAASIYTDAATPLLQPEHFTILSTEQRFHHIQRKYVTAIAELCEPEWPDFN